jgi:subtilisin-like proprotein convertase family protein
VGIQAVALNPASAAFAEREPIAATLGEPPVRVPLLGPFAIPDGGADSVSWQVEDTYKVASVALRITGLRHGYASDLVITLTSPGGAVATLLNTACGDVPLGTDAAAVAASTPGADFTFTDDASASVAASCATFVAGGAYLPATATAGSAAAGSMAVLAGGSSAGAWTLRFTDASASDSGFFDGATLLLTGTRGEAAEYDMPLQLVLTALPQAGTLTLASGALAAVGPMYSATYLDYAPDPGAADATGDAFAYKLVFGCMPDAPAAVAISVFAERPPLPPRTPTTRILPNGGIAPAILSTEGSFTNYVPSGSVSPIDAVCVLMLPEGIDDGILIPVEDVFNIASVTLTLPDVCHADSEQLTISLQAPPAADGTPGPEVFVLSGTCPGFAFGQPYDLGSSFGCLGEPMTFEDIATASLEDVCTGGALGPRDRSLPLPGGTYKPTVAAQASFTAGSMASLAGRTVLGDWTLRVVNAGGGMANFSCPLLILTDMDGIVHTYSAGVSLQMLQAPLGGLLYTESEYMRAAAASAQLAAASALAAPGSRRRLAQALSVDAQPVPVQDGDVVDDLRMFYAPFDNTTEESVEVYSYRFLYNGRATSRNITQVILVYNSAPEPPPNPLLLLLLLVLLLVGAGWIAFVVAVRRGALRERVLRAQLRFGFAFFLGLLPPGFSSGDLICQSCGNAAAWFAPTAQPPDEEALAVSPSGALCGRAALSALPMRCAACRLDTDAPSNTAFFWPEKELPPPIYTAGGTLPAPAPLAWASPGKGRAKMPDTPLLEEAQSDA